METSLPKREPCLALFMYVELPAFIALAVVKMAKGLHKGLRPY